MTKIDAKEVKARRRELLAMTADEVDRLYVPASEDSRAETREDKVEAILYSEFGWAADDVAADA